MYSPWKSSWISASTAAAAALLWLLVWGLSFSHLLMRSEMLPSLDVAVAWLVVLISAVIASVLAVSIRVGLQIAECKGLTMRACMAIPAIIVPIFLVLASASFWFALLTM